MFFCERCFSFFERCHSGGRTFAIESHAAIGLSLEISEIQVMGLPGGGFESCVGTVQIALTNIGGRRLQRPENALHLSSLLNCDRILRAGPLLVAHERISIAETKL